MTKVNELVNISSNFASHLHKAFSLISVNSKVMNAFYTISFTISMAKDIIGKGDEGRLSRNAIPVHELRTIIDKIHLKRQTDGPVFDRENCHMYYEMKLAHSWADQANFKLYTLLQIPIASLKDVQTLHILDNKNKIGSDLTMAVINRQSNCYRLLSASDYLECTTLNSAKLCQKRLIQINPRLGCSLRLMNCEAWTTDVVHDLSNSEVLILLRQNMNASLECDNAQKKSIGLPRQAIIRLSIHCKLTTDSFIIHKLSFKHLTTYQSNARIAHFEIIDESKNFLMSNDLKIQQIKMHERVLSLEELQKGNDQFKQDMAAHIKDSDELWNEAQGGQTPWEQIITWSLIGLSLALTVILAGWLGRLQLFVWKGGKSQSRLSIEELQDALKYKQRVI